MAMPGRRRSQARRPWAGSAAAALITLTLLTAGCLQATPPTGDAGEEPRPRAEPVEGPAEPYDRAWMLTQLPAAPVPFDGVANTTVDLKWSERVTVRVEGHSVQGRPILGVFLATGDAAGKPTVFLSGSQHGNEPSGTDGALLLAQFLAWGGGEASDLLDALNVYMLMCANPDGRVEDMRGNADGVDINRDHMNLATVEGQVLHEVYSREDPEVILDLHQFGSPPVDPPPTPVSEAIIFEVAAPQNGLVYPGILAGSMELEAAVVQAVVDAYGAGSASTYPPTSSSQDSSIHRNHYAMHNSLSLLFEARRGLPAYEDEVALQVIAAMAVLDHVAADPQAVMAAHAEAEQEFASPTAPPVQAYLAPPQDGLDALQGLLHRHGLGAWVAERGHTASAAVHYDPTAMGAGLMRTDFPAGTLVTGLNQSDWRSATEMFESWSVKDSHYTAGPRDLGVDVWRELGAQMDAPWPRVVEPLLTPSAPFPSP